MAVSASRAVRLDSFGGPEVLDVREVPAPQAGPGEIRVRVTAAGLNPMDWIMTANGADAAPGALEEVARLVATGRLRVPIAASFPVGQIRTAAELQSARHVHGKVVIDL